jgi:hypothetical protein
MRAFGDAFSNIPVVVSGITTHILPKKREILGLDHHNQSSLPVTTNIISFHIPCMKRPKTTPTSDTRIIPKETRIRVKNKK